MTVVPYMLIMSKQTREGGWTREDLAEWGVPWPPPSGWKRQLTQAEGPSVPKDLDMTDAQLLLAFRLRRKMNVHNWQRLMDAVEKRLESLLAEDA